MTQSQSIPRPILTILHTLMLIALAWLLFHFVVYVVYANNLIQFPFDYDQGEGFELHDVMLLSQFQSPYADIETFPFYGSIYPPMYHVFLVPFAWLFGAEYWYGRLFSFITTLITAITISWVVYRETYRIKPDADKTLTRMVAVASGLAFLSSNIVYHIGPLFRQHISMFMFETLAVAVFAHVNEIESTPRRRRMLLLGFGLLVIGGYTKQLAAFTAIAILLFLFIRNPRRAIIWGFGFAVVGAGIFALFTITTDGHWWTQTITANVKDFLTDQAIGLARLFLNLHLALLIPALLQLVYEVYFDRISVYSIWFVCTFVLSALAAGTWGAGDSYYATSVAAMCILSGIFISKTVNRGWQFRKNYIRRILIDPFKSATPAITLILIIIMPIVYITYARATLHMPTTGAGFEQIADIFGIEPNADNGFYDSAGRLVGAYADIGHLTTAQDVINGNLIVERINAIPADKLLLSEEAAFSFATNREVITNPVVLYILDQVGHYDSSELVQMLEEQAFGLIVLRARFYPPPVNIAIDTYYEMVEVIPMNGFDYQILRPKN
ncbi:MAG: hypothetical protein MUE54_09520 [Anaerolineae bacterium]|nr:hypothetical protein [Anaerolineae bacterium]